MEMTGNQIKEFSLAKLTQVLESKDTKSIKDFMDLWNLEIRNGKIYPTAEYAQKYKIAEEYWDKQQLVKKINLNAAYGSLLNAGSRFFDQRLGQSTTLTGRCIAKHMASQVNEVFTGEYDHTGTTVIYGDTDSWVSTTLHQTNFGEKTVEELFSSCSEFWNDGDKEYAHNPDLMVMSFDPERNEPYFGHINYIYRHRVSKDLYEIEDELGNIVTVTQDHSVMIERGGVLLEVKPAEIEESDILISIKIEEVNK